MRKLVIVFFVLCGSSGLSLQGQNVTRDSISSLAWMIGKWDISATLEASDGNSTKESGFRECSWVLGNRVIRCDGNLRNEESTYSNGTHFRSVITYIAYDKTKEHYKVTWIRSNGNHTTVTFKKKNDSVLSSEFTYTPPSLGFDMRINSTISRIDADHITELELLENEDKSFTERFELRAIRIAK